MCRRGCTCPPGAVLEVPAPISCGSRGSLATLVLSTFQIRHQVGALAILPIDLAWSIFIFSVGSC